VLRAFLAGTDAAPASRHARFSFHYEAGQLRRGRFTPMESLQTATSNPAKFLGMESRLGSIECRKMRTSFC